MENASARTKVILKSVKKYFLLNFILANNDMLTTSAHMVPGRILLSLVTKLIVTVNPVSVDGSVTITAVYLIITSCHLLYCNEPVSIQ